MKKKLITVSALILLMACRPTELLQDGKTKFYQGNKLNKIAVVALPGELMDIRAFENSVAGRLNSKETEVVAGHKLFEGEENIPADFLSIRNLLISKGFNGLVEIKLVSIRKEESSSEEEYVTNREYRMMDVANYGMLVQEYGKREEKGAVFEDVKVKMDFRIVDLTQPESQVIWSARTETSNPKTAKHVAAGMTNKVVPKLKKDAVLGQ